MKDTGLHTLSKKWNKAGINKGDTVLIHSSSKRTIRLFKEHGFDITPHIILDSFLDAVGISGTLLLPLFNFDFTEGTPFDIRNTPSHMGALTEAGRLHHDAVRTGHPIYSFAAIGHNAEIFKGVDNYSGYGEDSPFALLKEMDGKIAVLDLSDQNSMTFYHHVEEMHQVSYRYYKEFKGNYTNQNGSVTERKYALFVRDLDIGVLTHVNPTGELLWKNKLYKGDRPNVDSGLRVISAKDMYNYVAEIIVSGKAKGLLYRIENEDENEHNR